MSSVRIATLNDSKIAIKLLLNFHKEAKLPFNPSSVWALNIFKSFVNDDDKIAIIKEGGILLGGISQSILGPFIQSYELAWWVEPEHRGNSLEMVKIYEDWAKGKGAKAIELKSLHQFKETEKIYNRLGYNPLETSWIKIVE